MASFIMHVHSTTRPLDTLLTRQQLQLLWMLRLKNKFFHYLNATLPGIFPPFFFIVQSVVGTLYFLRPQKILYLFKMHDFFVPYRVNDTKNYAQKKGINAHIQTSWTKYRWFVLWPSGNRIVFLCWNVKYVTPIWDAPFTCNISRRTFKWAILKTAWNIEIFLWFSLPA